MTDLRAVMHDYVDQANTGVDSISLDEIRHLATTLELPDRDLEVDAPTAVPWYRHRRLPVAAVLALLALTIGTLALLSGRDGGMADDPEPPAPHVPSPLDLFPRDVEVELHHRSEADGGASMTTAVDQRATVDEWQQFLGIDPTAVTRISEWRPAREQLLVAIEGEIDPTALEAALASDPNWASLTTSVERGGATVTVREADRTEAPVRTPFGPMQSHAIAMVDGTLVVGSDAEVVLLALDRAARADTLGHVPGVQTLVDDAATLVSTDLYAPPSDPPLWYDAWLIGRHVDEPRRASLAIRVADGHDPGAIRDRIDDGLIFELLQSSGAPAVDVRVDGRVVTVVATYALEPAGPILDRLREASLIVAERPSDARPWLVIALVALMLGLAVFAAYVDRRNGGGRGRGPRTSQMSEWAAMHTRNNSGWGVGGYDGGHVSATVVALGTVALAASAAGADRRTDDWIWAVVGFAVAGALLALSRRWSHRPPDPEPTLDDLVNDELKRQRGAGGTV